MVSCNFQLFEPHIDSLNMIEAINKSKTLKGKTLVCTKYLQDGTLYVDMSTSYAMFPFYIVTPLQPQHMCK